ncbi:MAG: peptidylprolyl isomerase [Alcanivorax sp.]|jgi:FKBP-type peptidyl-prolyl cis-trans isomerase SlyD|uniref:FKBP-type peptidyl-prolyl cis-trans isomerase n=1 Tax=unclassified Ketobacter TaxID=2639109 RepID=UPI000C966715|nr:MULTISPECIES: peptidylprolyl isomerase [unclassified Ketobacter]MAA59734.1 peptidylprolyl isomerase [Pseudomonadales bacterium]MEC8811605.1 peptidylprolyl isomerase [Pseudomonadota bacterium]TNC90295.1 MAG: peptidylprolyl isomerase [Alcanivorax sp.]RLT91813.1 MAG: peptidylprolyl isomerase [Ketobacter sp. GenoA1]RLT93746.1 MAG: peptidylprolyl isomerase [Ketobacter sp.]|tara:strand:+ start:10095 stop:10565 length:471 start_codon:yes stop_codon:yes gene_type:complete
MTIETIANDKLVSLHITIRNLDGEILETTAGVLPMLYIHGRQQIPAGFEQALAGKKVGDQVQARIEPQFGYGVRDETLLQTLPRQLLDADQDLAPGMQITAETEDGPVPVRIVALDDTTITVDGNHAYAGQTLLFSAEIRNVRDATAQELAEGPHL